MPITQFLNGHRFDPETRRILGVAFEQVCAALRTGDCDDDVKQAIANKIIELRKPASVILIYYASTLWKTFADRGWRTGTSGRSSELLPALIQALVAERLLAL